MPHLRWQSLSPPWSELLIKLFRDLKPLRHVLSEEGNGTFGAEILDPQSIEDDRFWDEAHKLCHRKDLDQHRDEILAFEREFAGLFVDMAGFQPSAVRPVLEIVDFKRTDHKKIVEYLRLTQSVMSRKLVGKRMGLLLWDVGQTGGTRLFGAAILASARFSQQIRDRYFGWERDFPATSPKHDPAARAKRVEGLGRIMQLSIACAMPPYNVLSGAWLAALAPFTPQALEAFRLAHRDPVPDADLMAVVTTTSKGVSGAPFRGHRVNQLAPAGATALPEAKGDLYAQIRRTPALEPLRCSFYSLVSPEVDRLARELFDNEHAGQSPSSEPSQDQVLEFVLTRLCIPRSVFLGNEMGLHLGALSRSAKAGWSTLDHLRTGTPRPASERPLIDWEIAVGVWSRKFLPVPELVGEVAASGTKAAHREARQKRNKRAREFPAEQIRLSHLLKEDADATFHRS